jgi:AraC-like DNA-binding protein
MPGVMREGRSFEHSTLGLPPSDGLSSLRELFDTKVQLRFVADAEAVCSALAPLTGNLAANSGSVVRRDGAAFGLLVAYLKSLPDCIDQPELRRLITTHVYDLMILAMGATAEGRETGSHRCRKAARLQAIKKALSQDHGISIRDIARKQGVSPRYVQKLFEESGTTFTEYVLALRLEAARTMLVSPRYAGWTIVAIALEAGFGDLSHFNRRFKARYGQRPSEIRAGATLFSDQFRAYETAGEFAGGKASHARGFPGR